MKKENEKKLRPISNELVEKIIHGEESITSYGCGSGSGSGSGSVVGGTSKALGYIEVFIYQNGILPSRSIYVRATCSIEYDHKGFTYHCNPNTITVM